MESSGSHSLLQRRVVFTAVCLLLWACRFQTIDAEDVLLECEGYIVSPWLSDFSSVRVGVYNSEGIQKDTYGCTPNGYFYLLLEDMEKQYFLRPLGRSGWQFKPAEMTVTAGFCKSAGDLTFQLTTFTITGQVLVVGATSQGPPGVTVKLQWPASTDCSAASCGWKNAATETLTDSNGVYRFDVTEAGLVRLTAEHPKWRMVRSEVIQSVDWGYGEIHTDLIVRGFTVSGAAVELQGSQAVVPAKGLTVQLIPLDDDGEGAQAADKRIIPVETSELGKYEFQDIGVGKYRVKAVEETGFVISPANGIDTTVENGDADVASQLQIVQCAVSGEIEKGVEGAKVILSSGGRTAEGMSDKEGRFVVSGWTCGEFLSIQVTKDRAIFELCGGGKQQIQATRRSILPKVCIAGYEACGSVSDPEGIGREGQEVELVAVVQSEVGKSEIKVWHGVTDVEGRYCVTYPAALSIACSSLPSSSRWTAQFQYVCALRKHFVHYMLRPSTSTGLSPPHYMFTEGPLESADFKHAYVSLKGRVTCLGLCTGELIAHVACVGCDEEHKVAVDQNGEFTLEWLPAGIDYEVTMGGANHACWAEKQVIASTHRAASGDEVHVAFVQVGYKYSFLLPHKMAIIVAYNDTSWVTEPMETKDGSAVVFVCIPASPAGSYRISVQSFDLWKYSPSAYIISHEGTIREEGGADETLTRAEVLEFKAVSAKLTGFIRTSPSVHESPVLELVVDKEKKLTVVSVADETSGFTYLLWLPVGVPAVLRVMGQNGVEKDGVEQRVEYTPAEMTLDAGSLLHEVVDHEKQILTIHQEFTSKIGIRLHGTIRPPVEGVRISIHAQDGGLLTSATTRQDGHYATHTIHYDGDYSVSADLEKYEFTSDGPHNFKAVRCSSIEVFVEEVASEEYLKESADGKPLSGVLVSLLSADGATRTRKFTEEDGVTLFHTVSPGTYYLQPLLKGYKFMPSQTTTVEAVQGKDSIVTWKALRVAFSCSGRIRVLGDSIPEVFGSKGAVVQARSEGVEPEEASVDEHSAYELRGLFPGRVYTVTLVADLISASPSKHVLHVSGDLQGIDFNVLPLPQSATLTVTFDHPGGRGLTAAQRVKKLAQDSSPRPHRSGTTASTTDSLVVVAEKESPAADASSSRPSSELVFAIGLLPYVRVEHLQRGIYDVYLKSDPSTVYTADLTDRYAYHIHIPTASAEPLSKTTKVPVSLHASPLISLMLLVVILGFTAKYTGLDTHPKYQQCMGQAAAAFWLAVRISSVTVNYLFRQPIHVATPEVIGASDDADSANGVNGKDWEDLGQDDAEGKSARWRKGKKLQRQPTGEK